MRISTYMPKTILVFILIVFMASFANNCFAKKSKIDTTVYKYQDVDVPPSFSKGFGYITEYLNQNIVKPDTIFENGPYSTVYVEFIVEKDGSLSSIKTIEGYGDEFSDEVIRLFKKLPNWNPGRKGRKQKRVKCVFETYINTSKEFNDDIFVLAEEMPRFVGGEIALSKFLNENIKYPRTAYENGIQGRVYVTFVIEKDGSLTDIRVLKGIGGGCDQQAVQVVEKMPNWIPGNHRGKLVRIQYNLPIRFIIQ